jgi:hypothetical protein
MLLQYMHIIAIHMRLSAFDTEGRLVTKHAASSAAVQWLYFCQFVAHVASSDSGFLEDV